MPKKQNKVDQKASNEVAERNYEPSDYQGKTQFEKEWPKHMNERQMIIWKEQLIRS